MYKTSIILGGILLVLVGVSCNKKVDNNTFESSNEINDEEVVELTMQDGNLEFIENKELEDEQLVLQENLNKVASLPDFFPTEILYSLYNAKILSSEFDTETTGERWVTVKISANNYPADIADYYINKFYESDEWEILEDTAGNDGSYVILKNLENDYKAEINITYVGNEKVSNISIYYHN